MRAIMSSMLVASAVALSAPAYAATYSITSTTSGVNNATNYDVPVPLTNLGGGTFAGGTNDTLVNGAKPKGSTAYFLLNYMVDAGTLGNGSFSFTTTSFSNALKVLGFFVNGVSSGFTTTTNLNGSTTYASSGPFSFSGTVQNFGVYGSIKSGGTVGTSAAFQAAVPEVSTWLMMMAGIGMLGGALRVRRRKVRFQMA